jgi:hypothetical protein
MSVQCVDWAYGQRIECPAARSVLVAIAFLADDPNNECAPTDGLLAAMCSLSEEAVRRHIAWLKSQPFLITVRQEPRTFFVPSLPMPLTAAQAMRAGNRIVQCDPRVHGGGNPL